MSEYIRSVYFQNRQFFASFLYVMALFSSIQAERFSSQGVSEIVEFLQSSETDNLMIIASDIENVKDLIVQVQARAVTLVLSTKAKIQAWKEKYGVDVGRIVKVVQGTAVDISFEGISLVLDLSSSKETPVASSMIKRYEQLQEGARIITTQMGLESDTIRLVSTAGIALTSFETLMVYCYKIKRPAAAEVMSELLRGIDGFRISQNEADFICKQGGNSTYGEIPLASAEKLFTELVPLTKEDVFYDLGCGVGRLTLWVAMGTPVKRACGVELSQSRYDLACKAHELIRNAIENRNVKGVLSKNRCALADFKYGNILDANLQDATVIFICATCFPEDLMNKIADKLTQLKDGLRIVSLKEFPKHPLLDLIATHRLPMTWSLERGSPVYVYKVCRSQRTRSVEDEHVDVLGKEGIDKKDNKCES